MHIISKQKYRELLNESIELQKMKETVSKLTQVVRKRNKTIKNLESSVTYYKKISQKPLSNPDEVSMSISYYERKLYFDSFHITQSSDMTYSNV